MAGIVLMTNEMRNSYNQFLFHSFLSALHALRSGINTEVIYVANLWTEK